MTIPLLSVLAIVKDESRSIAALLDSCADAADRFCVMDTGSTDQTLEILRTWQSSGRCSDLPSRLLAEHPSMVVVEDFEPYTPLLPDRRLIDFAKTRNRLLDIASDDQIFTLFLSGDETLHGGENLRAFLEAHRDAPEGGYSIEMRLGSGRWYYTRVLRDAAGWRYVFPRHELPVDRDGNTRGPIVPGCWIEHSGTDPERRLARMRDGDLPILSHIADSESVLPDWSRRAVVYLAQTEEAIAEAYPREAGGPWETHEFAALGYYKRRVSMGGDADEINYAAWHYLNVAGVLGLFTDQEMLDRLEPLAQADARRPEIWYMIARHAANLDVRRGLLLALRAADVAKEAKAAPLHLPTDSRVEWLALLIACGCAKELGRERSYVDSLADRGLAAGAPEDAFKELRS